MEWFADRGHDITVLTVEPWEHLVSARIHQIDLNVALKMRKLGRLVSVIRMLVLLHRLGPDVVHVHYVRGLAWGLLLSRYHPCVMTPWGSDVLKEQGAFREWYSKSLTQRTLRTGDLITVHSSYMEARVRKLLPTALIDRIGWGVDLRQFRPGLDTKALRKQWEIGEERRIIFSPRLAQPFYQHHQIIEALPAIKQKIPTALLVITEQFADQSYVAALRQLASQLKVTDCVKFVGSIPYQQMPYWLNSADTVVMLPQSDGMPNTLLEAMACGTLPVLNRLPQYDELVSHGLNGFFTNPVPRDVAAVLVETLGNSDLKKEMAIRNRKKMMEVADQDREMTKMEDWYSRLANRERAR